MHSIRGTFPEWEKKGENLGIMHCWHLFFICDDCLCVLLMKIFVCTIGWKFAKQLIASFVSYLGAKKGKKNVELHKPEAEPARAPWLFVDDCCNLNERVFFLLWCLIGKFFFSPWLLWGGNLILRGDILKSQNNVTFYSLLGLFSSSKRDWSWLVWKLT